MPPQNIVTDPGGVEMVLIPDGTFLMGSPESEQGRYDYPRLAHPGSSMVSCYEGPQHEVTLSAFYIGRHEVTNEEYGRYLEAFPDANQPEDWSDSRLGPRQPVVGVSWKESRAFAKWVGGRLPTEAEWEYAARAGTTSPYLIGDDDEDLLRFAWYKANSKGTHPVAEKEPNDWGLYDVLGNVWEWCEDRWHDGYEGAPSDGSAWLVNPTDVGRVLRGGAFFNEARYLRVAFRHLSHPQDRMELVGFRVVCVPTGQ